MHEKIVVVARGEAVDEEGAEAGRVLSGQLGEGDPHGDAKPGGVRIGITGGQLGEDVGDCDAKPTGAEGDLRSDQLLAIQPFLR